ncbi:hypothetical protein ONZ51_g1251 [Trametes cubensis]|uniref:Uncharacterized protein n=1 Tax=Trametes cubensis TaxID=1111947 RepID=A0AAD7U453_9APHY|nr:hypothetical protein ONZ51_g1251 [Trametes cubensis]
MVLSNNIAALIGFGCEATLWGANCVLFIISLGLLYRKGRRGNTNLTILAIHCLLFTGCTAHFGLEFNHFYTTLSASSSDTSGVSYFANETKGLLAADVIISICDLLGDAMLVYRCWLMWSDHRWVVVLPILSAIAGFVCLCQVAHFVATLSPTSPVPPAAVVPLTTAGYALPLCTNAMATGLLALKIWMMTRTRHVTSGGGYRLHRSVRLAGHVIAVIVESGLIYLATQLVLVVLVSIKHPAEAIVGVIAVQVYGIAPTLIVIRCTLGITTETTRKDVSHLVWAPVPRHAGPTVYSSGATSGPMGESITQVIISELAEVEEAKATASGESVQAMA